MHRLLKIAGAFALGLQLGACGTDSGSGDKGEMLDADAGSTEVTITRSGGNGEASRLTLRLADAPIDNLKRVVIEITAIEFKRLDGGWIKYTLASPKSIDLMQFQGGNTAKLLANVETDADVYREIRLFPSAAAGANFVELLAGGTQPLQITGAGVNGIRLIQNFTISATQAANFILDFDLRQSIRSPGNSGNYQLKPVLRLVRANDVGNISGMVNAAQLTSSDCSDSFPDTFNAVYIYAGHDAVPEDIDDDESANGAPVATAAIGLDPASGKYVYTAAFLPAGNYTVAITCNADEDDPDEDDDEDDLEFFDIRNVTVLANDTIFL